MISSDTEAIQGKSISIQCRCNLPVKHFLQLITIGKINVLNDMKWFWTPKDSQIEYEFRNFSSQFKGN